MFTWQFNYSDIGKLFILEFDSNSRHCQGTLVCTSLQDRTETAMLCVNYLHLLHFSSAVLLWEPPLCWSGRGLSGCALGSNPQAGECCIQSCPGKSSPSLPARGGSAGPSVEVVLQDKRRNHLTCLEPGNTRWLRGEHHLVMIMERPTTEEGFFPASTSISASTVSPLSWAISQFIHEHSKREGQGLQRVDETNWRISSSF